MKRMGAALSLGFCALTAAQAFAATPPSSDTTTAEQPKAPEPQPLYKSIWRQDEQGNIVHLQSGLACDMRAGALARLSVNVYRASGLDVSCNYIDAARNFVTLYLTRREGQSLADDMSEAQRELVAMHPDVTGHAPVGAIPLATTPAFQTAFYSRDGGQTMEGIWIGDLNGWTLEYRVTWLPANETMMLAGLAALTARAQASAGAQLGLCAKQAAPKRDGTPVTSKDEIEAALMMQTILSAGAAAATDSPSAIEKPMTWCAENPVGPKEAGFLLWHAVFADGSDAKADRVTPASVEEPMQLMSDTNALAAIVDGENGKPERWTLSVQDGKQVWIYALYDGRPSADALAQWAADIASDKVKPVGGYKVDGKNITINMPGQH